MLPRHSCGTQRRPGLAGPCGQGRGHQWGTALTPAGMLPGHMLLRGETEAQGCWGLVLLHPCSVEGSLARRDLHDPGRARGWSVGPHPALSSLHPACTSCPPVPPHPAWPGAQPLAPSVGRPCPAQVFASGQGWAALPRRIRSEGGAPSGPPGRDAQGGLLGEGPRPPTDAVLGPALAAAAVASLRGRANATLCPPAHPEKPKGTKVQPCSGVGQSHLGGCTATAMAMGGVSLSPPLPKGGQSPCSQAAARAPAQEAPWDTLGTPTPSLWATQPRSGKVLPEHLPVPADPAVPCPSPHPEHRELVP